VPPAGSFFQVVDEPDPDYDSPVSQQQLNGLVGGIAQHIVDVLNAPVIWPVAGEIFFLVIAAFNEIAHRILWVAEVLVPGGAECVENLVRAIGAFF
jgi:hypothetical protein